MQFVMFRICNNSKNMQFKKQFTLQTKNNWWTVISFVILSGLKAVDTTWIITTSHIISTSTAELNR